MITISKDGTQIAYDKTGKGPALILVDGAFCYRNHGVTPNLVPLLSDKFTVYSYDRRGRGESSDTRPYSVEREIEDLESIVKATNEIPYILGISSGAALLIQAVGMGLSAKKIALFEAPYVAVDGKKDAPPDDAWQVLEGLVHANKRGKAVQYFMHRVMGVPAAFVFLFKIFDRRGFMKNESVAHTLVYDVAIMNDFSVPVELTGKINLPIMVITGGKSPEKLLKAGQALASSIPNASACLLKGQSHNVSMKVLAPVLINFFR